MKESLWNSDLAQEKVVIETLQKTILTPDVLKKLGLTMELADYETKEGRALQYQGADIILTDKSGHKIYIDEKATIQYMNTDMDTFCLELAGKPKCDENTGERRKYKPGWFIKRSMITEYYAMVWLPEVKTKKFTKRGKPYLSSSDEIKRFEVIFIKKNRIINWLNSLGLTREALVSNTINLIRYSKHQPVSEKNICYYDTKNQMFFNKYCNSGIKLIHSRQLAEEPVNLVVKRALYKKLADADLIVDCSDMQNISITDNLKKDKLSA